MRSAFGACRTNPTFQAKPTPRKTRAQVWSEIRGADGFDVSSECDVRSMTTMDYNGTGFWSVEEVLNRYTAYVKKYKVATPRDLTPTTHTENNNHWTFPIMQRVIEGIEQGDLACAEIGIEFIEEDASFVFGQSLKSNTARALRRTALTDSQKERIRKRVVEMLRAGYLPREYRQYAKLARKIGLGREFIKLKDELQLNNPWVRRYYNYFEEYAIQRGR